MRRWPFVVGAAVLLAGAGATVLALTTDGDGSDADAAPDDTADDRPTAEVVRTDLVRTEELDGTIGHGDVTPLVLASTGTLTALPAAGDTLSSLSVVAEVDGRPILAVDGAFPYWRSLGAGVDDGKDVLQLEYLLATLGYAQDHDVTVDEEWTSATTEAVEDFQADHGQPADGLVDLGELVVLTAPVRVADVGGTVGQPAGEAGITVTAMDQRVEVDLDVADADLLAVGDEVDVELPTGEVVSATVTAIGGAEAGAEDGDMVLPVTLTVAGLERPDGTPVTVQVELVAARGVLAVPVEAVLALAEGGYAVEVVDGATTHLVGVELGPFVDGQVEVVGDVAEGDTVVTA